MALLGRPNDTSVADDLGVEFWYYNSPGFKIVHPLTGRPSRFTAVLSFDHGRVTAVSFFPL
jgi:hypothetical protein